MKVNELPTDSYYNWLNDADTDTMLTYFDRHDWLEDFRSFMVWVEDGEYKEVYGCFTQVPYLDAEAHQLVRNGKIIDNEE